MNKKVIAITVIMTLIISSCVQNPEITSDVIDEQSQITIASAEIVTETTTTKPETSYTTVETTQVVPEFDMNTLKAVLGEKGSVALECKIIDDITCENEADFPNKADIALAKKQCFVDAAERIKDYDMMAADDDYYIPVEKAEDIAFSIGVSYDFDDDGENESVIYLDYMPTPAWYIPEGAVYYVDGNNVFQLSLGGSPHGEIYVIDYGIKRCLEIVTYAGAGGIFTDVYSFDSGTPEKEISCNRIEYENGVLYCFEKFHPYSCPVIMGADGVFNQLALKEITSEDFCEHINNGMEYLDYIKSIDVNITKIYTRGYGEYWLFDSELPYEYLNFDIKTGEIKDYSFKPSIVSERDLTAEKDNYTDLTKLYTTYIAYPAIMTSKDIEHSFSDFQSLPTRPENLNPADVHIEDGDKELPENIKNAAIDCLKNSESYMKTTEALKKSGGKYILGSIVPTADTDENFCPAITVDDTVGADFDGDGKNEYFVALRYFDLEPEFEPYETTCCVYVNSDGKAELVIPKSVGLSIGIMRGESVCHAVFSAGENNTTKFFSIYSVKNGKPRVELEEWMCISVKDGTLEFWNQVAEYFAVYDLNSEKYVLFRDETAE